MFSPEEKHKIAEAVQKILQEINHWELPKGEIEFLLHVDGEGSKSWANIKNNNAKAHFIPEALISNMKSQMR